MRYTTILLSLIATISVFAAVSYAQFDYSQLDSLLEKHVNGDKVNYKELILDKEILFRFTTKLAEKSPDSHPDDFKTKNEQLTYWINAYNAFILKKIVEHYPIDSIKDINFIGFTIWLSKNLIGGEKISFKSLEDDIIRERFNDPRIHFAINCASFSCPPLKNQAYIPEKLDDQMDESTRSFINNLKNFKVDEKAKIVYFSSIFDWYDDDFNNWLQKNQDLKEPHLLDFIKLYYNDTIPDDWYSFEVEFLEYDWRLNDYQ